MSYNSYSSNVTINPATVEYGKFVELQGDNRFPAISVTRYDYRDSAPALSSVEVYPKYAVITYLANPEDIKVSLSADNINVNLEDVEDVLNVISPNVADIENNTGDIKTKLDTANTLLNAITANTDATETILTSISGYTGNINTNVADIEALATTTNTAVGTINTNVGTTNTAVGTINTAVGTINTNVGTTNTAVGTINTRVNNIHGHAESIDTKMPAITALLTTTNTNVGTINTNVADIETLLTTTNTLVNSVSALLGNQLGINGVVFCQPSDGTVTQNFNAIQVLSACKFSAIGIAKSTTSGLTNYELPQNFTLTAPITSLALSYGAVIAFK